MKKIIGKIHLWMGLASGLVVFIIAITGCLYSFRTEIEDLTQPYRFTEVQAKPVLSPSELQNIAEKELEGHHAHSVAYEKGRSAKIIFYEAKPLFYQAVFINPYTGEVLKVKDLNAGFFRFILNGHFYLWLPPDIGQPVVATATLIFIAMLVTGIILWWPKNKKGRKQRFTIKWNARWRRRNYDLHNVIGFYISWFVIILALTGLVWGFQWFENSVYWLASGGEEMVDFYIPDSDTTNTSEDQKAAPVDEVLAIMQRKYPDAKSLEVHFPHEDEAIEAVANPLSGTIYRKDYRYFDQHTLEEIPVEHNYGLYEDEGAAGKLMRMNYDIHIGAILGFPGKLLVFFISLITASLPVTGFILWLGRKNKRGGRLRKSKNQINRQAAHTPKKVSM